MITTTHSAHRRRITVGTLAAMSLLALPAVALAEAGPLAAPAIPGVAALPGPVVDPGKPAAEMKLLKTTPDIALAGTAITIVRERPARRQGRHPHLGHGQRRLDARCTGRQRRLPRPQGDEVRRAAGQGAHERERHVQRPDQGTAGLRRPARDLRGRRRRAGREGRLPARALGLDQPEAVARSGR